MLERHPSGSYLHAQNPLSPRVPCPRVRSSGVMEDDSSSPSSSTLYEICRLLNKTADGFEKMANEASFLTVKAALLPQNPTIDVSQYLKSFILYSRQPFLIIESILARADSF